MIRTLARHAALVLAVFIPVAALAATGHLALSPPAPNDGCLPVAAGCHAGGQP